MISIKDRFGASWPIFGGPFVSAAADHNWPNLYQASNPPGGRAKYLELYQRSNCRLKIVSFSQPQKKSWHYCFILKFKIDLARHRNGLVSIRMSDRVHFAARLWWRHPSNCGAGSQTICQHFIHSPWPEQGHGEGSWNHLTIYLFCTTCQISLNKLAKPCY